MNHWLYMLLCLFLIFFTDSLSKELKLIKIFILYKIAINKVIYLVHSLLEIIVKTFVKKIYITI